MENREYGASTRRSFVAAALVAMLSMALAVAISGCASPSAKSSSNAAASASSRSSQSASSASTSLPALNFQTKDIDGNAVSFADLEGAKLILVNLWEPWCGPCVQELPYLQRLYETYQDRGLVIIGAYTTTSEKSDIVDLINENGITYPILYANNGFTPYKTRYVPTSMLFDGQGRPLLDEPLVGSRSYQQWEELVKEYL